MKKLAINFLQKAGAFQAVSDFYHTAQQLDLRTLREFRRLRRQSVLLGRPLPPLVLVTSAAGTPDLGWFLKSGEAAAACIRDALTRNAIEFERLGAILDFGCGCGRVVRHLRPLTSAAIHGVDINHRAVRWCRRNLSFASFWFSKLQPPLSFSDRSFDLVYALSVFTHLPESLEHSWVEELFRVLKPGGHLFVSLHGPSYTGDLSQSEQDVFQSGQLVVRSDNVPGSNRCASYHPPGYAEDVLFRRFELVEYQAEGALGNPHQDVYLFRKIGPG